MTFAKLLSRAVMSGTNEERVEELRKFLKYTFKQRDPGGSKFWYLHPGVDESEAKETCPIAVGFYSELNDATDGDIRKFLTAGEPQPEIYKHYTSRFSEDQPAMYLLLPTKEGAGRVPLVLPNEGGFQESPEALTEGLADKSWSSYVKERLLPRIFGFELLMLLMRSHISNLVCF